LLSKNKNIKIILNYVVGPLVFCLLCYSIYRQLLHQPNRDQSLQQLKLAFTSNGLGKLLIVTLLMLVNWGIEARKWQVVISRIQKLSFIRSCKAVFSGTTLAFFTPNRMGEYMGRVLYIEDGKRIQAVSLTIVCSISQLLITLLMGLGGLIYVKLAIAQTRPADTSLLFWMNTIFYTSLAGAVFLTLFYFRLSWLVRWIERIPRIEKFLAPIRVLDSFNATLLLRLLSLSLIRYLVFIVQYYLLFAVFNVSLDALQVFWAVSVVFLVLAIVPTIAIITEVGVRWKASIEVVQLFNANTVGILAASLSVWIINLVIPALIGSLLILGIKIFSSKIKN
jgi:hypothetical protein